MIHYLVTRRGITPMQVQKEMWAGDLRHRIHVICYEQIVHYRHLTAGTCIFADLERLSAVEMELAVSLWQQLQRSGAPVRLVNDPSKVLRREALLHALHRDGLNPFTVHRPGDDLSRVRFPAFLRRESGHTGNLSEPLEDQAQLAAAIQSIAKQGVPKDDILIVEFCDTADGAGMYRKYSAFRVGGQFLPRHMLFSKEWVQKYPDLLDDAFVAEESEYLKSSAHEEQIAKVFGLANIEYGRIDYGMLDGQLVTWEINTNPTIGLQPIRVAPERLAFLGRFMKLYNAALAEMEIDARGATIPLHFSSELKRRMGYGLRNQALRWIGSGLRRLGKRSPWRQAIEATA
jgi:hypothetical protein